MLTETGQAVRNTSWEWLASTDGTDGLAPGQVIDPFDSGVYQSQRGSLAGTGVTYGHPQAMKSLLQARLGTVIGALPSNGQIHTGDGYDADDDLFNLPLANKAVMAAGGQLAQPVAAAGQNPMVGTDAAATCVAVLGRVRFPGGQWLVGCTHLAASDMRSFDQAYSSIGNLLTRMAQVKAVTSYPVQLYAVGGREDEDDDGTYQELSRLIGAIEQQVQDRPPGWLELAGAVLPANDLRCALAVHISSHGVVYTSEESSGASSGDEQIDD
jgi:hypothetical protein